MSSEEGWPDPKEELWELLNDLRKESSLSMLETARRARTSTSVIYRWIRERRVLADSDLQRLLLAFNADEVKILKAQHLARAAREQERSTPPPSPGSAKGRSPRRIMTGDTNVVVHPGGTLNVFHGSVSGSGAKVKPVPPAVEDLDGHQLKPDPLTARNLDELEELLREFWRWAGSPSSRRVAGGSEGAFSHATIAKLLADKPGKPPLKQEYVVGLIRGCGGDEEEQKRWITAWRSIERSGRSHLHAVPDPAVND
jgi:transcriptional regulator with XRE-family HTH domain